MANKNRRPTKEQRDFVRKLKTAARNIKHTELAERLGLISDDGKAQTWKVRNWLYDNHPNVYAVSALTPKLDKLLI